MLIQIIIASSIGSILALMGGIVLLWKKDWMKRVSLFLVSFAAGTLLGAAFFDLLPEALEAAEGKNGVFAAVVLGILAIFIFEKILRWHHCHDEKCDERVLSSSVLCGDAIHNFLDGIAIAAAFLVGVPVGIATTIAVFFHEVPQEIGDFGVLLHAGYSKGKILMLNVLTAMTTFAGAIGGYFLLSYIEHWIGYILAFTAGVFIYIATSDLIPEVRHKEERRALGHTITVIIGVVLIFIIGALLPE
ncbi:MAG: ZIP family metal transporter [Nanoarchaeota archaeon]|nr:ZIP family metal transporter [Nanoarchaeota archaeon]